MVRSVTQILSQFLHEKTNADDPMFIHTHKAAKAGQCPQGLYVLVERAIVSIIATRCVGHKKIFDAVAQGQGAKNQKEKALWKRGDIKNHRRTRAGTLLGKIRDEK